jgi:Fe-S cluster assembly iron-binding protein IscA
MSENGGFQLDVTQEAKEQVRELIKGQKPGTAVRVYLQSGGGGGGCGCGSAEGGCGCGAGGGGPSFGMAFDRPRNGDKVVPVDGFSIVVDDMSAELLQGATIDYVQDLNTSGFKITAPNVPAPPTSTEGGGCGCGSGGCGCG